MTEGDPFRAALGAGEPEDDGREDESGAGAYEYTEEAQDLEDERLEDEERFEDDEALGAWEVAETAQGDEGAGDMDEWPPDDQDEDFDELVDTEWSAYGQPEDGDVPAVGEHYGRAYGHARPGVSRPRRRRRLAAAAAVVVAALVVLGAVGFVTASHDINPTGRPGKVVSVKVPSGASTGKIADLLASAGVIHGPLVFELYVKLKGAGALLPGTYHLAKNEPYSSVIYELEKGPPPLVDKLVVPEGFTVRQIAAAVGGLTGVGISAQSFLAAATSGQVRSPYEPAGTNSLEGLLFPATYPVQQGETADDLVQYMVDTFDYHASQVGLSAAAARLHYSPYQVITVASIVEREAKFESDRGPIASVIYNRLSKGMPIGAESTLLYGLGDPKGPVNMETPNPYNTLIHQGLPPSPISNPGIPSLNAAMGPPKTSFLFWVETNPDGKMSFASNQAQFAQLQLECKQVHLC